MGPCEECIYYIWGTCDDGEEGYEACCFEPQYEEDENDED